MKRIVVVSIIVEQAHSAPLVNDLLHEYAGLVVGRMGLPLKEYGVSVITVVCLATNDQVSALSGKLGRIDGLNVKVSYSAASFPENESNIAAKEKQI